MRSTEAYRYRGYDIVATRQWSSRCTGIYATRPDLPLLPRSILSTMAPRKETAIAEAKDAASTGAPTRERQALCDQLAAQAREMQRLREHVMMAA